MESEKAREELKNARESIKRNKDVESARVILEKCIIGDWAIIGGRINYIKLATQIMLDETTKQEKIIELMAKRIREDTDWFYSDLDNKTEKEIIEYFEKKVEGIEYGKF